MIKFLFILLLMFYNIVTASVVTYNLDITEDKDKDNVIKYNINKSSPGPTIIANINDDLIINVTNNTNAEILIHWHGILVPNAMDGVPNVTSNAILPKASFTYKYKVKQTGDYWYHAHNITEASGVYGAISLLDTGQTYNNKNILLFSGKYNKNPVDIFTTLTNSNKMLNTLESTNNHNMMMHNTNTRSKNLLPANNTINNSTMHEPTNNTANNMQHYSDVFADKNLINNKENEYTISTTNIKEDYVTVTLINSYADGMLNFVYSGGQFTIIAADGVKVKPIMVDHLPIAMGETYEVQLPILNKTQSYEMVGFILGSTKYSKVIIGNNNNFISLPNYNVNNYNITPIYNLLESINYNFINTNYTSTTNTLNITLSGNHSKYNWKILQGSKNIENLDLKVGSKVKLRIFNHTSMPHPMHLHGMFFKIVSNKNTLYKHTYNIEPHETIEIEFIVDEKGKWVFHCHNLFHMLAGMMITFNVD